MPRPHPPLILVDLRVCQVNRERGIPVFTQSLWLALGPLLKEAKLLFWHDPHLPPPLQKESLSRMGTFLSTKELCALSDSERITDYFVPCFTLLRREMAQYILPDWLRAHQPRRLGLVLDVIPLMHPELYLQDPTLRGLYMEGIRLMRRWDLLFAISDSCRQDTIHFAGVDPSRIVTIDGGLDTAKSQILREGRAIPPDAALRRPYMIYVGGDDWRKNLDGAIEAFASYRKGRGKISTLVLACHLPEPRKQDLCALSQAFGLTSEEVVITGRLDDAALMGLVQGAELSFFPSRYEGLGLPILESYACGTPVVGSETSSMRELLPPACRFNPERPEEAASALHRFDRDPELRKVSLAFGAEVLKRFTWDASAKRLIDAAFGPIPAHGAASGPVAMVGVLPPATSGIARFNHRYMHLPHREVHWFWSMDRAAGIRAIQPKPWSLFASPRSLRALQSRYRYVDRLFVFGNSDHHLPTLEALRECAELPGRTWLHLHDADLMGLWLGAFAGDLKLVHRLFARYYPEWKGSPSDLLGRERPLGIRPLAALGLHVGIIVNSKHAEEVVLNDLGTAPSLGIQRLFLPIEPQPPRTARIAGAPLRIGSFGKPEKSKQLDRVVAAAKALHAKTPVSLVIAGYEATKFLKKAGLDQHPFLEVLNSPSDQELLAAVASVDVAVQLRYPSHGESSAALGQTLGFGIPTVVTNVGSFTELGDAVETVSPHVTPAELAATIQRAASDPQRAEAARAYATAHSPSRFQEALEQILSASDRPD
jgi:glycosyltransferase involved in cell wall biosynthesis